MRPSHLFVCLNAFCLTLLAAGPAFTQTPEASEKTSTPPAAYVYLQTSKGVDVYDANAAGGLTLVKGSPFAVTGLMSADNGKHLISVGTDNIHVYTIESNGAVGKQAAEIDTQKYSGAKCGTNSGAGLLDHTGKYLYLTLWSATDGNPFPLCAAVQTYKLASNGELTFLGDTENFDGQHQGAYPIGVSTISSNDKLGYGEEPAVYANNFLAFKADANGALLLDGSFSQVGPTPDPSIPSGNYFPLDMAADPASHLAVLMNQPFTNVSTSPQLASFTINDTTGAIVSTNNWADMPTPQVNPALLEMSPSGKLLVVAGAVGIQLFHFNGAAPITPYSGVLLPNVTVIQMAWDNNNHLYARSYLTGELYVFTVTPTSIHEVSGSPYKIPGLEGMIVVSK